MKHLLSLATIAVVTLFLNGCKQEQEIKLERTQPVANIDSHRIPREQAIAELNSLLDVIDADNITRGGAPRRIKEVIPVLAESCIETTRMSEDEAAAAIDTLLYLVNFEDENGYAVLSATEYLAPILAVTDSGSTDPKDWLETEIAGSIWDSDDCCILDDEDDEEDDDEEDDGDDDSKIAFPFLPTDSMINLNHETGGSSAGYPDVTRAATVDEGNHSFEFVRRTIYDYCEFTLIDRQEDLGNGGGGNSGGGNSGSGNSGGGNSGGGNNGNTDPAEWQTLAQVQPMLKTIWDQGAPFNRFCPSKNNTVKYPLLRGHAPAGCTAVALGQILVYNKFPDKINGISFIWDQLLESDSSNYQIEVAKLLYILGKDIYLDMKYDNGRSSSNAYHVYRTMKKLGYKNTHKYNGYKENTIIEYLETDRPFYINAISPAKRSGNGKRQGHAWVIDGYIKRQRGNKTEIMMHCNMGQLGYCDGYYSSGIFDSTQVFDEDGDLIGGSGQSDKTKYCRHYRFVKYDKPTLQ